MTIKKTALYSPLWASCDELRGGMDASHYKDYVLTLLFMKYVSDKYKGDSAGMMKVPKGASFSDMKMLINDKEIGAKINHIIRVFAEANALKGTIDIADFNDEDKLGKGKEMVDRLSKLIAIFDGLDLSSNRIEGDDLLGSAYEFLMRHFATESSKSKGQFYTPSEVSHVLAQIVGINQDTSPDATVYDPTCGSGSLLLKVSHQAPRGLTIYGQEMDSTTAALARMNMILYNAPTARICQGNTLASPCSDWREADGGLKTFDFAVANPPFSAKSWTSGVNVKEDKFQRFDYGVPPEKNGDYAFLLHILKSLKSTGKGAVILPHGVLFRGHAEAVIRRNLLRQGYIRGIIGLPSNLFYGTGISACVILLDKATSSSRAVTDSHADKDITLFIVDASKGFMKDGNKNRLRAKDVHKIVDACNNELEIARFSRKVPLSEIIANDYNLNIPRYINASDPEDIHDLSSHLKGGIPDTDLDALQAYWDVFPSLKACFFEQERDGYAKVRVTDSEVNKTILAHSEFMRFTERAMARFKQWHQAANLKDINKGTHPKALITELSEEMLKHYSGSELLDKYDLYQILMDYWEDTLQDDVYTISQDGWEAGRALREVASPKNKDKYHEVADITLNNVHYKGALIPSSYIISNFFATEQKQIHRLEQARERLRQTQEAALLEHSGEGRALEGLSEHGKKVKKVNVERRITDLAEVVLRTHRPELAAELEKQRAIQQKAVTSMFDMQSDPAAWRYLQPFVNTKGVLIKSAVRKRLLDLASEEACSSEREVLTVYQAFIDTEKAATSAIRHLSSKADVELATLRDTLTEDDEVSHWIVACDYLACMEEDTALLKSINSLITELNAEVLAFYPQLSIEQIKDIVVEQKWLATLQANIQDEVERVTQVLAHRLAELERRYAVPLPTLEAQVDTLRSKVASHLNAMGLEW
ncbi:type I restriction endonuclease subunit M [Vibrio parahaemolyticus]|uniref:type I restriction-modification system subunit M n=1 Tax=Vibrio parahaemolyticus TaxID=670 RepID=UPI00068B6904|nr:class I SAM-dependent DNA methyltransferase [Vibrio parahaemolyticus]OTV95973.1 type I restriction endonuclease subunit M [Vibrio parahaemolyticus]OTW00136.1 type I restriction endonuclease subunit M [Vibrio parahaemolyticus]